MTATLLVIVLAYLVGSIPMAYVIARWRSGIDLRQYGSGNVGASNIYAHVGKWFIIPLGLFDLFVKGAFPVFLASQVLDVGEYATMVVGLAILVGSNWSIYLRFTGGRGMSVAIGILAAMSWPVMVGYTGVALVGWIIFRSSAFWVGTGAFLTPFWSLVFREHLAVTLFCAGFVLITATKRLLSNRGTAQPGLRWRDVVVQRLLYDRDIPSRDEWVYRAPPGTEKRSQGEEDGLPEASGHRD